MQILNKAGIARAFGFAVKKYSVNVDFNGIIAACGT